MNNLNPSSRREILSAGAMLGGTILSLQPSVATAATQNAQAGPSVTVSSALDLPVITKKRTLGRGRFSMEVSALGFGVMGMN